LGCLEIGVLHQSIYNNGQTHWVNNGQTPWSAPTKI